jgi:hypothetical protein
MTTLDGTDVKVSEKLLELNGQGEITIEFTISDADLNQEVLTVALSTYIGYSQEKAQTPPFASSHSVPILKADEYDVEFTTESTVNN